LAGAGGGLPVALRQLVAARQDAPRPGPDDRGRRKGRVRGVTDVEAYEAEVVDAIDAVIPVAGAYVLGSALLGGFDPATSDLDVVVVVERPLDGDERAAVWRALDELPPPVRKLELVVYAAGARPPAYDLNYPDGDGEPGFW